ncbi:MAG: hypothetical protein WB870_10675 [Gallionellaceae bacterium]
MKLELLEGGRAQLELEILLRIAEPREVSWTEFQELTAPLRQPSNHELSVVQSESTPQHR